jgi:hypothetical protein
MLRNEAAATASERAGYYLPAGSSGCERVLNAYCRAANKLPLRGGDRGGGYARYVLFDGAPGQIGRFFDSPFIERIRIPNETIADIFEDRVPGSINTGVSEASWQNGYTGDGLLSRVPTLGYQSRNNSEVAPLPIVWQDFPNQNGSDGLDMYGAWDCYS